MKAEGEFVVSSWKEIEVESSPLMRVSAVFETSGEINGRFDAEYLMHYCHQGENPHDNEARYGGFLLFRGSIGERSGTFALEDTGVFANSAPSSELTIIGYSGTEGFFGIKGGGRYYADNGKMIIELDC